MEALMFLVDSVAMLVLVYYGLMDERRPPGAPMRSPFRYFEHGQTTESIARKQAAAERRAASR